MSHDSNRTRIWFPMFSYFESSVDGIIPNEYDSLDDVIVNVFSWIIFAKDCCMLTARRFWIDAHSQLPPMPTTSQMTLFGRSLNDLVLNASPVKQADTSAAATAAELKESFEHGLHTATATAVLDADMMSGLSATTLHSKNE